MKKNLNVNLSSKEFKSHMDETFKKFFLAGTSGDQKAFLEKKFFLAGTSGDQRAFLENVIGSNKK